jgi:hypothetical protein
MEPTVKAILARFKGNRDEAYAYCMRTLHGCNNADMAKEYFDIAVKNFHPLSERKQS